MMSIQALGQTVQPQPIVQIPGQAYAGLQVFWQKVRNECEEHFTPAQCRALLGARPTMLQPEGEGIAWYWIFLGGLLVGKVIL